MEDQIINCDNMDQWIGKPVKDNNGVIIGKITDVKKNKNNGDLIGYFKLFKENVNMSCVLLKG